MRTVISKSLNIYKVQCRTFKTSDDFSHRTLWSRACHKTLTCCAQSFKVYGFNRCYACLDRFNDYSGMDPINSTSLGHIYCKPYAFRGLYPIDLVQHFRWWIPRILINDNDMLLQFRQLYNSTGFFSFYLVAFLLYHLTSIAYQVL